ncbi:retrovirus-related Pol polyprotein from transposon TNT 1-94 [Trichonephila clavipes]|nr:retrovirus-related Pol polyprotein from transposon TNT 1-94 [Trichonephila clavipes]
MYWAFQAIGTLSPEFQGIVQILYPWPDEDFKLGKIEIELIAKENWLKQLKNDLSKLEFTDNSVMNATSKFKQQNVSENFNPKPDGNKSKFKKSKIKDRIGPCYLFQTSKVSAVNGLPKFKNEELDCESCKLAKTNRVSFKPIGRIRSTRPLQLVHMDVHGSLPVVSCGGAKYFLSITDDFSRMVTSFPLKEKSQVFECFKSLQANAERVLNRKILSVRSDNGMEFCHSKFSKYLNEREFVINLKIKTPYELYFGRKPTVSNLKVFGGHVYVGIPKQLRNKLDLRAKHVIILGYACSTRGYRIWLLDEKKLVEACNVLFDASKRVSNGIFKLP